MKLLYLVLILNVFMIKKAVCNEVLKKDTLNDEGRILKQGEFLLDRELYSWDYKALLSKKFKFTVKKDDKSKSIEFAVLEYQTFREIFNKCITFIDSSQKDRNITYEEGAKIFMELQSIIKPEVADFAPKAGSISVIRNPVNVYIFEEEITLLINTRKQKEDELIRLVKDSADVSYAIQNLSYQNLSYNVSKVQTDPRLKDSLLVSRYLEEKNVLALKKDKILKKIVEIRASIASINTSIISLKDLYIYKKRVKKIFNNSNEIIKAVEDKYKVKRTASTKKSIITGQFYADSVRMEFFEGNIKNFFLFGSLTSVLDTSVKTTNGLVKKPIVFRNFTPIPFSSLSDYTNRNSKLWQFPSTRDGVINTTADADQFIMFYDIIKYYPEFSINQEDYSPRDGVQTFKAGTNQAVFKEVNSKLFKVRVYSDFVGVKDDNPNGLIQLELSKRVIINPRRTQFTYINKSKYPDLGIGKLSFIEPSFTMSKIEENNKYLVPSKMSLINCNCTPGSPVKSSVDLLDLYKYQNFSAGGLLNLLVFDNPDFKASFYLNLGVRLFRTSIRDTTRIWKGNDLVSTNQTNQYNISTFQIFPEVSYQVKPDSRFGFSLTARGIHLRPQSDKLFFINNSDKNVYEQKIGQNFILNYQLDVFIRPDPNASSKGEIFGRIIYSSLMNKGSVNFTQIQVGYSFNILKKD